MNKITITFDDRDVFDLCLALRLRVEACEENGEDAAAQRWRALMQRIGDAQLEP